MSLITRIGAAVDKAFGSVPATNVASWLYGATTGLTPHEPFAGAWQRNMDQVRAAGPNILAFTAIYACINVISSDIARLPLRVLQVNPRGGRFVAKNHYAMRVLRKPNPFQTSLQFLQQYYVSKLTHGNTYVYLVRDGSNRITEMYVLDPRSVQPLITDDGGVYYQLGREPLMAIANPIVLRSSDIMHDRCLGLFHPLIGVSPLFAAAMSAMTGSRIMMNSETFFANMSRSSGVLTAPGKLDPAIAKRMQAEWDSNYSGKGLGKVAVLSNGLKYEPMTINAADAELVNQLRWVVEDCARAYRVPTFKLSTSEKSNYRNSEQMARDYFQNCLSYHIEGQEQVYAAAFGLDTETSIEFDMAPLFRMETDVRYSSHQIALNAGFKSINEVRNEEDLPPVPGGDEPRVQAQYIPLSKATGDGVHIPGQPTPAPAPAPAEDDDESDEPTEETPAEDGAGGKSIGLDLRQMVLEFTDRLASEV